MIFISLRFLYFLNFFCVDFWFGIAIFLFFVTAIVACCRRQRMRRQLQASTTARIRPGAIVQGQQQPADFVVRIFLLIDFPLFQMLPTEFFCFLWQNYIEIKNILFLFFNFFLHFLFSAAWLNFKSALIVINMLCHSVVSLGKILYGNFSGLVVLISSSKFQSYLYKTKKKKKKIQPNNNILASLEAVGIIACPAY